MNNGVKLRFKLQNVLSFDKEEIDWAIGQIAEVLEEIDTLRLAS